MLNTLGGYNVKKWLVVVKDEQYDWIKRTAEEVGLKGSAVVREVIERARTKDNKEIRQSLLQASEREQLEDLLEERALLDKRISDVKNKTKALV